MFFFKPKLVSKNLFFSENPCKHKKQNLAQSPSACRAPGPPERARAETGGADQWVLKRRELPGFAMVNEKKRPHPWDTHRQFSIKILLSNTQGSSRSLFTNLFMVLPLPNL